MPASSIPAVSITAAPVPMPREFRSHVRHGIGRRGDDGEIGRFRQVGDGGKARMAEDLRHGAD